ncbi:1944_t:CDS:1, partial [Paraglomus occultum]
MPSVSLRKRFEKLRDQLETKAGEEFAEEVETILNDCEGLVTLELELESEIIKRKKLLEDAYQKVLNITVNINEKIEASGNIYIANILKHYNEIENDSHEETISLKEILEKDEIYEQALITRNDIKAPVSTQRGHVVIGSYVGGNIFDKLVDNRVITQSIVDVK